MADITQLVTPGPSSAQTSANTAPSPDEKSLKSSGNVQSTNNLLFTALNMIDTELFYREEPPIEPPVVHGGLVTQSLAYLVGDLWDFYETNTKTNT